MFDNRKYTLQDLTHDLSRNDWTQPMESLEEFVILLYSAKNTSDFRKVIQAVYFIGWSEATDEWNKRKEDHD